jgi:hypothetical protein
LASTKQLELTYLTNKLEKSGDYDFVRGWGVPETPSLVTNSSDHDVRIPGLAKAHSVVVHPSPTLQIAVGWRSPFNGNVRVTGQVTHAHHDCGNGVTWTLEHRRGGHRQILSTGIAHRDKNPPLAYTDLIPVRTGDLVSVLVGPRDGEHSCDLSDLQFTITNAAETQQVWSLTNDISSNPLAGNPHADAAGSANRWHFYTEPVSATTSGVMIPPGSLLARWQASEDDQEQQQLAQAISKLIGGPAPMEGPDALLYTHLVSLTGPLVQLLPIKEHDQATHASTWGIDPQLCGQHPHGTRVPEDAICVQAPATVSVHLPAELAAKATLTAQAVISSNSKKAGGVRVRACAEAPKAGTNNWWSGDATTPILIQADSSAQQRLEQVFNTARELFPASLCYSRIVPVDEVVTLKLFFREDDYLARLVLTDQQQSQLNQLWETLFFVSQEALIQVDAYEQIWEYATQGGGKPTHLEPLRQPILDHADAFRKQQIAAEPAHLDAVIAFAEKAYRRPHQESERADLKKLYSRLRKQNLSHEDSIQLLIARVLLSPSFLYKSERPGPGNQQGPVDAWELANRLSYFLWSSQPDEALRAAARSDDLLRSEVLVNQTKRMLGNERIRRMATEFGCAWVHILGFDQLDEKSTRHFPTFPALKGAMYEESIQYFTDLLQHNRSILSLLESDHTYLNETLAHHYGIPHVSGPTWRRVEGVKLYHRGGLLGLGATLAQHSGASRTSPILRGNWIAEVLLGDKLPKPPKDVPQLPDDEASGELTMREITEKHTQDPRCSTCHAKIDPFGYTLESFDAIGRWRDKDLANRPLNTVAHVPGGHVLQGVDGLRSYLLTERRDAFVRQCCKKLLGYALGRGVLLSDRPLLDEMMTRLSAHNYEIGVAIEAIVLSKQFREIRGKDAVFEQ